MGSVTILMGLKICVDVPGSWGESGYMRLERNIVQKEGAFGILMAPSYPMKKSANPKHVPEVSLPCLICSQ